MVKSLNKPTVRERECFTPSNDDMVEHADVDRRQASRSLSVISSSHPRPSEGRHAQCQVVSSNAKISDPVTFIEHTPNLRTKAESVRQHLKDDVALMRSKALAPKSRKENACAAL